jgi:hypothetical protein
MQYLISVIDDTTDSATGEEMAAIDAFNERLGAEGHWVFAGGLAAPASATVIDNRAGAGVVTDGPFLESKEYLGGFWVIEAPDLDVALALGASRYARSWVETRGTSAWVSARLTRVRRAGRRWLVGAGSRGSARGGVVHLRVGQ